MRHLLMDHAFPDIVGEWAAGDRKREECSCANDNPRGGESPPRDPPPTLIAKLEIAATRLW